jgi:hypothetical protein
MNDRWRARMTWLFARQTCARQTCARQMRSVPAGQASSDGPGTREHGESGRDAEAVVIEEICLNGRAARGAAVVLDIRLRELGRRTAGTWRPGRRGCVS